VTNSYSLYRPIVIIWSLTGTGSIKLTLLAYSLPTYSSFLFNSSLHLIATLLSILFMSSSPTLQVIIWSVNSLTCSSVAYWESLNNLSFNWASSCVQASTERLGSNSSDLRATQTVLCMAKDFRFTHSKQAMHKTSSPVLPKGKRLTRLFPFKIDLWVEPPR